MVLIMTTKNTNKMFEAMFPVIRVTISDRGNILLYPKEWTGGFIHFRQCLLDQTTFNHCEGMIAQQDIALSLTGYIPFKGLNLDLKIATNPRIFLKETVIYRGQDCIVFCQLEGKY